MSQPPHSGQSDADHAVNPWQTHATETAYENPWIRVEHRTVTNPAGGPGIYGLVHFKNVAVGVVPIDESDFTWLVGQYRYTLNAWSWEIPEGGSPMGEDPLDGAKRELLEETGLTAKHWDVLIPSIHTSNSVTDEDGIVYRATGLVAGQSQPEPTELLQIKRLPLREAVAMAMDGRITDAISVAALLRVGIDL